jgi:mannose-6-phosphate isomerase-like protein (cupin superfamily)
MLYRLLTLILAVLIGNGGMIGSGWGRIAAAQEGTPAATPEVVIVDAIPEYFAVEIAQTIPAPPAVLVLLRLTLEPGAVRAFPAVRETASLVLVEAGTMTSTATAPVTINRERPGGEREEIAAGTEFTASVGDFFVGPATGAVEEARNEGQEPLTLLVFVIDLAPDGTPAAVAVELSAGVSADLLAADVTEAVPPVPALLELLRFTFAPGGYVELPETSPATALIYVEAGEMTVTMDAAAVVERSAPGAPNPERDEYAAGTEFTVAAGQSMIGPPLAAVDARNDGEEPLVILMAVVQPAPAP